MGVLEFVMGREPPDQNEIEFFKAIHRDYEYWVLVFVFLALNILVGIRTANKHKKD